MQKNELIHFHNLLGTISTDLYNEGLLSSDDLEAYRELGTSPMTMHGSRAEHEAAVTELAGTLAEAVSTPVETAEDERTTPETESTIIA